MMNYHFYKTHIVILSVFLNLIAGYSQENLKAYTSDLDPLWNDDIYLNKISPDGNWVTINEINHQNGNILHLKDIKDSISFDFPQSVLQQFSNNNQWFAAITSNHQLKLINLNTRIVKEFPEIESFEFSSDGTYLGALQKAVNGVKTFLFIDLKTLEAEKIREAVTFSWHPTQNKVALTIKNLLGSNLIGKEPERNPLIIYSTSNSNLSKPLWSCNGSLLIIIDTSRDEKKIVVSEGGKIRTSLSSLSVQSKFPGYRLGNSEISISDSEDYIFFYREEIYKDPKYIRPQEEWNTEDPWDFPRMKRYVTQIQQHLLTAWHLKSNALFEIATPERPSVIFNKNLNYSLVFNEWKNEPKYKEYPFLDIYLKNFKDNSLQPVVENLYGRNNCISISPNGKYIIYFKNLNWWCYNTVDQNTYILTQNTNVNFYDKEGYTTYEPYEIPIWDTKSKFVLLSSEFDIWKMNLDTGTKIKITDGEETAKQYRIATDIFNNNLEVLKFWKNYFSYQINLDQKILLEVKDVNHRTGYSIWNPDNEIRKIVYGKKNYQNALAHEDLNILIFKSSKYNEPPAIYTMDLEKNQKHSLFQTNQELTQYDLGKSEIIEYKNNKGKTLKASLLYPSNYDPEQKYPMVVLIYENLSGMINDFSKPTNYSIIGFNPLTYVTNDYFVLCPDIIYDLGHPGKSALECVTNAVKATLKLAPIDKNSVGLIGHSFGGYETAFIATQTDLFKAAVAGSAITNVHGMYHSMGWNFDKSEMWRFEGGQFRMNGSFYKSKSLYFQNSPINFIENLNTPLFLWAGKNDYQVDWNQSIEFFLAMKRLNKKGKLTLFEDEAHTLEKKYNQEYLSKKIFDWFEYYLNKKLEVDEN